MKFHCFRKRLLVLLLLLTPATSIFSQTLTSATVVGTVRDSTGAVIPNATVRIRQLETDAISTTVSGTAGQFRLPFLKPGNYEVRAETSALTAAPQEIQLLVGQELSVDLVLGVQSVKQTVVVE